jgi:hypothetical protein
MNEIETKIHAVTFPMRQPGNNLWRGNTTEDLFDAGQHTAQRRRLLPLHQREAAIDAQYLASHPICLTSGKRDDPSRHFFWNAAPAERD